jgi:hypothetical protein
LRLSPELRVMLSPGPTYRRLAEASPAAGARTLLRRPVLVAVLVGAVVSLSITGALVPRLWPSVTVCWAFVPGLQLAAGAVLVRLGRRRPIAMTSALDLLFVGHGPWSLWLLGVGAADALRLPVGGYASASASPVLASAIVPLAWTVALIFAFCRAVLGLSARGAAVAVLLYELALWSAAACYVSLASARDPLGRLL